MYGQHLFSSAQEVWTASGQQFYGKEAQLKSDFREEVYISYLKELLSLRYKGELYVKL